jgi:hypothetical protein
MRKTLCRAIGGDAALDCRLNQGRTNLSVAPVYRSGRAIQINKFPGAPS